MRMRLYQAVVVAAVLTASATASRPAASADLYDTYNAPAAYDMAPVPPQDVFEGWWLGGTVGGASVSYDLSPGGSVSSSGVLGGVVGGYSWQHGPYVVGVEGDFMASDISGSRSFNGGINKVSPGFDTLADLRLRAGYTILPNLLLFGTFGGAWADADLPISGPGGAFRETTFFGWSVGGGAEFAFDQNWSARLDYQFTDFDAETISYPGGKTTYDPDANTFRGSVIYRF
ncbi:MAG: outer membrane protein [Methyloceanibacter sp.]|uniref:outer membrane protein n=1 Tax=Methyloceanibacter sp. TaxID=1965321 RepID=UPI003EE177AD